MAVFSVFQAGAATFSSKQLLDCTHEAEWISFQAHCFSENLVVPGIEHGTSGLVAGNSDHYTTETVINSLRL
jgi:hypothetical protein